MKSEKLLNISEFAAITGMTRQALIYYDKIGLFSPERTGKNGYRQYSHKQIGLITVIETLAELNVPLKDIKKIISDISPENAERLYEKQLKAANKEIRQMLSIRDMIITRLAQVKDGLNEIKNPRGIRVEELKEDIPIYSGKKLDIGYDNLTDEDMVNFFTESENDGLPFGYSTGVIVTGERLKAGEEKIKRTIFFRLSGERFSNDVIPKGKYAVAYARGDYGATDYIYSDIRKFLKENSLSIDGCAYEEYLFDEVIAPSPEEYLLKVMVKVK